MRAALVIGGGPAGSATAIALARAGLPVRLVERTGGTHDKVCGDFLSGPALAQLAALGIDAASLGAVPIRRVRLVHHGRMAEAALPFPAAGLSRRVLDEALLAAAEAAGAAVARGAAVRQIGDPGAGQAVILATGKHDLRGRARPGRGSGAVGFKTYLRLAPEARAALADAVEMVLLPGGYAGLQRVEGERAVLCAMFERAPSRTADLPAMLADASPHMAARLAGALPLRSRPLAVAAVPYGHLQKPGRDPRWLWRVGDQAAVIPSIAGDGVAIALRSAMLAAGSVLEGEDSVAHHARLAALFRRKLALAMVGHRLALHPTAQPALLAICRLWPGLMRFTAALTRCYQPGRE